MLLILFIKYNSDPAIVRTSIVSMEWPESFSSDIRIVLCLPVSAEHLLMGLNSWQCFRGDVFGSN